MDRPNAVADRFIKDLRLWLTADLVYHCFTGERDGAELERISKLDPWLQQPLLNKAEREWPERLRKLDAARLQQKQEDKAAVQQFVLNFSNVENP